MDVEKLEHLFNVGKSVRSIVTMKIKQDCIRSSNPISGCMYPKNSQKYLYAHVHFSLIEGIQDVQAILMSIDDEWCDS